MSMTAHGMNLKNPLRPLPTERLARHYLQMHQRPDAGRSKKSKIATPASKPKPSKARKPYFFNPANRD